MPASRSRRWTRLGLLLLLPAALVFSQEAKPRCAKGSACAASKVLLAPAKAAIPASGERSLL